MTLWGFAWAHVRRNVRGTGVMVLALVFAVTSFVTLASASESQRLTTTQTVSDNFRSAYDILVRPASSRSQLEERAGLIKAGFMGEIYGGISQRQLDAIRAINGVDVAAPMAVLGATAVWNSTFVVDVTDVYPAGADVVMFSSSATLQARQGAISIPAGTHVNVIGLSGGGGGRLEIPKTMAEAVNGTDYFYYSDESLQFYPDGFKPEPGRHYVAFRYPLIPYTVAAIDPDSEARLVGLDSAVDHGRYLAPDESVGGPGNIPALLSSATPPTDLSFQISIGLLPPEATAAVTAVDDRSRSTAIQEALKTYPRQVAKTVTVSGTDLYATVLAANRNGRPSRTNQIGNVSFDRSSVGAPTVNDDGSLSFAASPVYRDPNLELPNSSAAFLDGGPRSLTRLLGVAMLGMNPVGTFDPARIEAGQGKVGQTPLQTYANAPLVAADDATLAAIGPEFVSTLNALDLQQEPPSVLIPMSALPALERYNRLLNVDPISTVRVRIVGNPGADELSNERLRSIAEQIQAIGGLDVDIAAGSSATHQTIHLPPTKALPGTTWTQFWSKKGVAIVVQHAIDAKSLLLACLVLASSVLTIVISATASVAARRRELAVLSAIGWRGGNIRRSVLAEMTIIGLVSGVAGAVLALPVAGLTHLTYNGRAGLAAIPASVLLCLVAGWIAAATQARVRPIEALRPVEARQRRFKGWGRSATGVGLTRVLRRPGRVALAALALALGTASLTALSTIATVFRGAVTGTVLGEVVTVQVRTPDRIAAVCLAILGLISVATVLVVGLLEDSRLYATLTAIGWSDARLAWTQTVQALYVGVLGAALGFGGGLLLVRVLTGSVTAGAASLAGTVAGWSVLATLLVAVVPAGALRRLPVARLLSQE